MSRIVLGNLIAAISSAPDVPSAAGPLLAIGKLVGLERPTVVEDFTASITIMDRNGGQLASLLGWSAAETKRFRVLRTRHACPVRRVCKLTSKPFVWRAADIEDTLSDLDAASAVFWQALAACGITGGFTVPIHLPMARTGVVGWLSTRPELDLDELLYAYSNELRLASHLFMDKVQHAMRWDTPKSDTSETKLSERELECLTWVALGKTDTEIGHLIGRAASTARFHVDSAVEKLGVNNRTRAAVVATQRGMILVAG